MNRPNSRDAPRPDDEQTRFVRESFFNQTRSQWKTSTAAVIVVSVVLAAMARHVWPLWVLASWLCAVAACQAVRVHVLLAPWPRQDPDGGLTQSVRRYINIAPVCGAASGVYFFSFGALPDTERVIVTLLTLGQLMGFVANGAGQPRLFIFYVLPVLVPMSAAWMLCAGQNYPGEVGWGVGLLLLLLAVGGLLRGFAHRLWTLFDDSCRIRFREQQLNERLTAALQLAELASQAKTRFLAAASHDLRQPMHVMGMLCAALKLRTLDATSHGMVETLNQVHNSMSSLMDALLDISRLDAGRVRCEKRLVRVQDVISVVSHEFAPLAQARGLDFRVVTDTAADLYVQTDPDLLLRILNNLCDNAIKFTDQGSVLLRVRVGDGSVLLDVEDTGCGIDTSMHEAVFHEFVRVGASAGEDPAGLGLGLSIVRRLVELLGADLTLESTPGEGTRFHLRIGAPVIVAAPVEKPPGQSGERLSHPGMRVLVLDDHAAVREATTLLLQELGCTCCAVGDAAKALSCAPQFRPDAVLSDLHLAQGGNGIDAIRAIRQILGTDVPALVLTGDTQADALNLTREHGIGLLHKPAKIADLVQALERLSQAARPVQGNVEVTAEY